jgi:hypothetical protein
VIKKKVQMILKYKDLIIEMQCVWNVKTRVIPVITGANETILKSFRKHLSNTQESTKSRNYQKKKKNSHTEHSTHTAGSINVKL